MFDFIYKKWFDSNVVDNVSIISAFVTIVGFGFTVWVLIQTSFIKKYYLNKIRIPEALSELSSNIKGINEFLNSWSDDSKEALVGPINKVYGVLINLKRKVSGEERRAIKAFLKKDINVMNMSYEDCWAVYGELCRIESGLRQINKDNRII